MKESARLPSWKCRLACYGPQRNEDYICSGREKNRSAETSITRAPCIVFATLRTEVEDDKIISVYENRIVGRKQRCKKIIENKISAQNSAKNNSY